MRLDTTLRGLSALPAPPPSSALEALVRSTAAVRTRVPSRDVLALVALSLPLAFLHAYANGLRTDMSRLSPTWLVAVGAAWLLAFVAPLAVALVPSHGSVLAPTSRAFGATALALAFVVVLGITVAGSVAAPPMTGDEANRTLACLVSGLEVAVLPFAAAMLVIRRVMPVDARGTAAALGGAGGALGGFALHMQCESGGALHVGVGHAGVAVLGAAIAYAAVGRFQRGQ